MSNLIKCLADFFSGSSKPVGLCGFEHAEESEKIKVIKHERKREMRLSELME